MKKIATATIATAGIATFALTGGHHAHAAEQTNHDGYNPNDLTHTATLIQSMHKVTIITLGKVTGHQIN